MERNYIAFISYRHKPLDIAVARRIHHMIERYTIPRELRHIRDGNKRLGIVFRDQDELAVASDLSEELRRALDHSEFLVVICTPDTPQSQWVSEEIRYFLSNPRHSRRQILAVLASGEPECAFPPILTWDDAENRSVDPLAADVRSKGNGLDSQLIRRECKRLIAPMVGCNFDDLIQRERRRRLLRGTVGIAAALAVCIGFSSMLLVKNREIDAQKREVQLRESQLLAEKAGGLYENGQIYDAVENAIQALSQPGDEAHAYYAPAESVLMEAVDVFSRRTDSPYLSKTVIEQTTSIANLCFSPDGSRVVTIDSYGELRCFDTVRGILQWTAVVTSEGFVTPHLLTRGPQGDLLCSTQDKLYSLSMLTGKVLWERPLEDQYFIYDRNRDRIACVELLCDYNAKETSLSLTVLSAETGEPEKVIPLGTIASTNSLSFTDYSDPQLPAGGAFSGDGRYYAGAFIENPIEDGAQTLHCFVVDLEQETGSICLSQELGMDSMGYTPVGLEMRGEHLYLALSALEAEVAAMAMKVNWQEGSVQWQMRTPEELDTFTAFLLNRSTFAVFDETSLTVAAGNGIYAIDLETGEILNSAFFSDRITAFQKVDGNAWGISLSNGSYILGWRNSNGFHFTSDSLMQMEVEIGEHTYAKLFGDGILHLKMGDGSLEISLSFEDSVGSLATVDTQNENRLLIQRPIGNTRLVASHAIELLDSRYYSSDFEAIFYSEGQLVLGVFAVSEEDTYLYTVIDANTHAVEKVIKAEIPSATYNTNNWILPDASGYIRQEENGGFTLVQNGKRTILAEKGENYRSAATGVYLPDGSVVTLQADAQNIVLWQDGQEVARCALPEEQAMSDEEAFVYRLVQVGPNGYALVGKHAWGAPVSASSLAIYNWVQNTWGSLKEEITMPDPEVAAFAKKQPLLAFVDGENNLCVWDLNSGETICRIPTAMSASAVNFIGFLLDDTHLLVKTKDSLLSVYDLATGELNYQEKLDQLYGETMNVFEDRKNQRLYIIDSYINSGTNGVCLDLRSWTKLGEGRDMLCFDERTGELYRFEPSIDADHPLKYSYIPDTDELVHLGQEFLNAW